jgi:uncharacterized protein
MLYVENVMRNTVLVRHGRVADRFWTKFRGLMGVRHLPPGDGLLIRDCDSVHTHFMRMPIDVLYVDAHDRIVGIDASMKAWRIGRKYADAAFVIELPSGTAIDTRSVIGDQLKISVT